MSVDGKFDGIARVDLLAEAERFSVPRAAGLIADVHAAIENWSITRSAGLNETKAEELRRDFYWFSPKIESLNSVE